MGVSGAAREGDVQVRDGSIGDSVGEDGSNPKRKGWYRVIGLVEVLRQFCAVEVNCWIKRSVVLHDTLHRFRTRRVMGTGTVTGTATIEAKLVQKLMGIAHNPLFQVFLDLRKAYDSLDRDWCL